MWYETLVQHQLVPDGLIRVGIRKQLIQRLKSLDSSSELAMIGALDQGPIAVHTQSANQQHYEVPSEFFERVLGKHLKYSCGYWENGMMLDDSERCMLDKYIERAQIREGQRILDLGCGWGSLSLYLAKHFPKCQITAVSNSTTQKKFIETKAARQALSNIEVVTADMNVFEPQGQYDRILSIEMFEHMRNYRELMRRVNGWLAENGKLFVHIFSHREKPYLFDQGEEGSWMARYFFSGGLMPSDNLLPQFSGALALERQWTINGSHYSRTCEAWLSNMDQHKKAVKKIFDKTYGNGQSKKWISYWRIFFMACSELFRFNDGNEWHVSHYLFKK